MTAEKGKAYYFVFECDRMLGERPKKEDVDVLRDGLSVENARFLYGKALTKRMNELGSPYYHEAGSIKDYGFVCADFSSWPRFVGFTED